MWSAVAFSFGIFIGNYASPTSLLWMIAVVVLGFSGVSLLRERVGAAFIIVLAVMFTTGALLIQLRPPMSAAKAQILPFANGNEVAVSGRVTREGTLQGKDSGQDIQKVDFETEQIAADGLSSQIHAGLRITISSKQVESPTAPNLGKSTVTDIFRYGERLSFPVKLSLPRNFRNPGAFDYEGYLAENGIAALGSVKLQDVKFLPGFSGSRAELWRTRVHRGLIEKIQALWPANQAALVDTVLLGDSNLLGVETRTDFQRTGTYHVLVVSGLKVGILALVTFWMLRRLRLNEFASGAITALLAVSYALLTDVGAPVWRATLMLILYLATRLLYRQRSILNTVGAAALALLVVDPSQLFGASFQLSFLCMLVIGGIGMPILDRTLKPLSRAFRNLDSTSYDFALSPRLVQFRLDLRLIAGRLQRFFGTRLPLIGIAGLGRCSVLVSEFVLISVLLQAGFVLPMAYYFHRATLVSLPANIIVVPLTEIIMIAAGIAIGLGYFSMSAAKFLALLAGLALKATDATVRWMGGLRIADTRVATPGFWVTFLTCVALVLAIIMARRRPMFAAAGLVAIAASAIWISFVPPRPDFRSGVLEITAIDVGQGDSILLVTPQGRTVLVDAGGLPAWMHSDLDVGEDVVSPYLWSRGISHLDTVAITHAHADHIGGMPAILANFHPHQLWLAVDSPSLELQYVLQEAERLGIPMVLHTAGDKLEMGGANVRILAPLASADLQLSRPNDTSLVMKVTYKSTSALLEGDAERREESLVLQEEPRADLLKVAHHGSATSTASEFLAAVHPRFAVISVGARNVYCHPRQEVLDRLAQSKVGTYRTDTSGAVTFYLDGRNVIPAAVALASGAH